MAQKINGIYHFLFYKDHSTEGDEICTCYTETEVMHLLFL